MSYVNLTPAYYAQQRPETPYQPGSKGWLQARVPGWGENPNSSWSSEQAINGLGAAPPCTPGACPQPPAPPFSYVGLNPFKDYYRPGNAPWGSFPRGPAYAAPRPIDCPECVGMPIRPGIGALRGGCGPCEISAGDRCLPCPDGSDLEECAGCVGGQAPTHWYDNALLGGVAIGVLTAIGTGVAVAMLKKRTKIPVGE